MVKPPYHKTLTSTAPPPRGQLEDSEANRAEGELDCEDALRNAADHSAQHNPVPGCCCCEFRVWGLGFRVWGLGFRVWGLGFRVWGLGLRDFRGPVPYSNSTLPKPKAP